MGTKAAPILSKADQKCLQGVSSTEETNDGQEEGPSTRGSGFLNQEIFDQILNRETEDQLIGDARTNNELSTLIEKVKMAATETMTEATQYIVEAYIREGGPANENPM